MARRKGPAGGKWWWKYFICIHGDNDNFICDDNNIDQENVQIEAENTNINHHRKLLTKNCLVNNK